MSKISPRVREQAAVFCGVMASWYSDALKRKLAKRKIYAITSPFWFFELNQIIADVQRHVAGSHFDASCWIEVQIHQWAEAEALLRTGWEP